MRLSMKQLYTNKGQRRPLLQDDNVKPVKDGKMSRYQEELDKTNNRPMNNTSGYPCSKKESGNKNHIIYIC